MILAQDQNTYMIPESKIPKRLRFLKNPFRRPFLYIKRLRSNPESATYFLPSFIYLKAMGLVYGIAFASFKVQALGLIGSRGILPVSDYLERVYVGAGAKGFLLVPTIFWLHSDDWFIGAVCFAGIAGAICLMLGVAPKPMLVALFVLYLSLVTGGQRFTAFQWDALLLEAGFLAIFLCGSSKISITLFRWLLFRLMFLSGIVKLLSGDASWREFTALAYHYETQPLPTVAAWYAHQLPLWFHKISAVWMFITELIVPFLIFGGRRLKMFAGGAIVFLQLLIMLTGNYTFFNILAIALCVFLYDDVFWRSGPIRSLFERIQKGTAPPASEGVFKKRMIPVVAPVIVALSLAHMWQSIFRTSPLPQTVQAVVGAFAPFRIVNSYGLFAVMTTVRPEIMVEGSRDGEKWSPYDFRYKPDELQGCPRWVAPHQPRLDWQMWFAALRTYQGTPWFVNFVGRLLEGSPEVLGLLKNNPFPDAPPKFIRARLYRYGFTTPTGGTGEAWWKRADMGFYLPSVTLTPP